MAKKFPLEIVIGATDKASAALRRVTDRIDKFNEPFSRLRKSFGQLADKTGLSGVGTALANVGSVAWDTAKRIAIGFTVAASAIGALIYKNLMLADNVGDTAARLNISTNALQAYTYGFEQADVSAESLTASLDTLNKNLGLAQIGMGKALPIFRGLAIDPKKFKTIDQLLPVLADRLSRIHDPAKRAAIASRLLGDAGAQMALKLGEGPKALRAMEEAARNAGAIIDPSAIENAGKFDMAWKSLRATFKGVAGNALGELSPALNELIKKLQQFLIDHKEDIEKWAADFGEKLPGRIKKLSESFDKLMTSLKPAVDAFSWINDNVGIGNAVLIALSATIGGSLIGAILNLGVALAGLGVSMSVAFAAPALIVGAVAAAVAAGWYLYKHWDKISDAIGGTIAQIVENFSNAWESVKSAASAAFEWIVDKLRIIWEHSPLYLAFKGLGMIAEKLGIASTPQSSNAPAGAGLLQQSPAQRVQVSVDLSNLPAGTRANASASDGVIFDLSRGWAMPGIP